jgi:hypothetical protein
MPYKLVWTSIINECEEYHYFIRFKFKSGPVLTEIEPPVI